MDCVWNCTMGDAAYTTGWRFWSARPASPSDWPDRPASLCEGEQHRACQRWARREYILALELNYITLCPPVHRLFLHPAASSASSSRSARPYIPSGCPQFSRFGGRELVSEPTVHGRRTNHALDPGIPASWSPKNHASQDGGPGESGVRSSRGWVSCAALLVVRRKLHPSTPGQPASSSTKPPDWCCHSAA